MRDAGVLSSAGALLFAATLHTLHNIQTHTLEAGGHYGAAIHEYALAGERPPNTLDLGAITY